MRGSASLLAASTLGASALVLPSPSHLDSDPISSPQNPKRHSIQLACSTCTFPSFADKIDRLDEKDAWTETAAQDVVLDFAISQDGEQLLLNGEPIFRAFSDRRVASHTFNDESIYVEQVPSSAPWDGVRAGDVASVPLQVTRSELIVKDVRPLSLSGDALIPLKYIIHELEEEPSDVDDVEIVLLRTSDGELLIMQMHTAAELARASSSPSTPPEPSAAKSVPVKEFIASHPPFIPAHNAPPCHNLPAPLCRLKNMIVSTVSPSPASRVGGCHRRLGVGRLPGHIEPSHLLATVRESSRDHLVGAFDLSGPRAAVHDHRHHGHGGRHGHHHGHRSFVHSLVRSFVSILIPTLAGIAMGITVSIVALVLGRFVSFMWRRFVCPARASRSGRLRSASSPCESLYDVKHVIVEEDESDDESLPGYEEAPAYEEFEKQ